MPGCRAPCGVRMLASGMPAELNGNAFAVETNRDGLASGAAGVLALVIAVLRRHFVWSAPDEHREGRQQLGCRMLVAVLWPRSWRRSRRPTACPFTYASRRARAATLWTANFRAL